MTPQRAVASALAVVIVVLATGCTPTDEAVAPEPTLTIEPSASSTPSSSPNPSPSEPTSEPSASAAPPAGGLESLPLGIPCDELVTPQALYDFNPNVGSDPAPQHGELVLTMAASGGVACGWLNQSSGARISAGVIRLTPDSLAAVRSTALDRAEPSAAITDGYFRVTSGVGHAEIIGDDYWIVIESTVLIDPIEANSFAEPMRAALS